MQQLPKPQPAFIWYPYAFTKDFPQLGSGGRNAMAGPVYYTDMYPEETRYPDYYDKKLFIYDWIRGWMKAVTMRENGDFDKMEPFLEHTKFNNLIDLEAGPDGKLYGLEYGAGWFLKNNDAGLFRIDYNSGNIAPQISAITIDKTTGGLPFVLHAHVKASDFEKSKLTYNWNLGNGQQKQTTESSIDYTYSTPGEYAISVEVKDDKNAAAKSDVVNVYAGNETPVVNINIIGNKTFYFPGTPVKYNVTISDKDDTAKVKDLTNLMVSADYAEGKEKANAAGHQVLSDAAMGKSYMLSLDCKGCHKVEEKSIGPSFTAVAAKYKTNSNASAYLAQKIISGGSGVWGEVAMPAHPSLKQNDASQIITYILSLGTSAEKTRSLPATGSLPATLSKPVKDNGWLYISASYTDKGGANIKPLTGDNTIKLRNAKVTFGNVKTMKGFTQLSNNNVTYLVLPASGWFSIDSIDLTSVHKISTQIEWQQPPVSAYNFEIHLDSATGKKLGAFSFAGDSQKPGEGTPNAKLNSKVLLANLNPVSDGKLHNIYITVTSTDKKAMNNASLGYVQFFIK